MIGTVEATTGTRTVHPTATTTYTLTATNKAGSVTDIAKVTTPPTINGFAPEPQKINKSGLSTLHWETSDADTITITPDTGRQIETAGLGVASGSCQVFPDTTTTYTLEASNAAGSVTLTATVTVPLPVIHSFDAQPKSCISIGETSTLSWTVSSDEIAPIIRINIANDNPSIEPFSPPLWEMSRDISMNKTTTFTLEAENQNGSATATVTVTVGCVVMAPIEPSPTYPIHPNIRDLLP